jgi:hypothetical protein
LSDSSIPRKQSEVELELETRFGPTSINRFGGPISDKGEERATTEACKEYLQILKKEATQLNSTQINLAIFRILCSIAPLLDEIWISLAKQIASHDLDHLDFTARPTARPTTTDLLPPEPTKRPPFHAHSHAHHNHLKRHFSSPQYHIESKSAKDLGIGECRESPL